MERPEFHNPAITKPAYGSPLDTCALRSAPDEKALFPDASEIQQSPLPRPRLTAISSSLIRSVFRVGVYIPAAVWSFTINNQSHFILRRSAIYSSNS